jgi:adenylosuccinate synthase
MMFLTQIYISKNSFLFLIIMKGTVLVGAQWGDEGKGKITDILSADSDLIVRFQGGNNAGHTIKIGDDEHKFHLLPSGVLHEKQVAIAQGVVLNPEVLYGEIENILEKRYNLDLSIDPRTQIIMPWHMELDIARENARESETVGKNKLKIGTTSRGIGPAYEDRKNRSGIRFHDLLDKNSLEDKVKNNLRIKKQMLELYGHQTELKEKEVLEQYLDLGNKLKKYEKDVSRLVIGMLNSKNNVLFEGAQGIGLDNDFGTYPYCTSSNVLASAVFPGVGLPIQDMDVIGITKAYTTKVGPGPFPAEMDEKSAELIREKGNEYGTTTGRPRRVGWLDLVQLDDGHVLNNYSTLALTKLDILGDMDSTKVCVGYKHPIRGMITHLPESATEAFKCKPLYLDMEGFSKKEFMAAKNYSELPKGATDYVETIEKYLGTRVGIISKGPAREETIIR